MSEMRRVAFDLVSQFLAADQSALRKRRVLQLVRDRLHPPQCTP